MNGPSSSPVDPLRYDLDASQSTLELHIENLRPAPHATSTSTTMDDPASADKPDLDPHSVLLAAANHDTAALRELLRTLSANVQDPETGFTPLHVAIAACEEKLAKGHPDTDTDAEAASGREDAARRHLDPAVKTIRLLFENGAIWNDLNAHGETPGCMALRLGINELYHLCVDAGVRAELLLSRLDQYQLLADADSDDQQDEQIEGMEPAENEGVEPATPDAGDESTQNPVYLSSTLSFDRNRILDSAANGVMMQWESTIMRRSADLLLPAPGLRVLNVGHGMGIVDAFFQEKDPSAHHIIEAHPDVLQRMKDQGWHEKPGVTVHEGRWQDVVPTLIAQNQLFDAIYFDTFAEEYSALREFFTEHVVSLLDPAGGPGNEGGKFGFFNGMGADRQICYDVYGKIVDMDLFEAGFDTEWEKIPIPDLEADGEWEGVRRKYWMLDAYQLPTCSFIG